MMDTLIKAIRERSKMWGGHQIADHYDLDIIECARNKITIGE